MVIGWLHKMNKGSKPFFSIISVNLNNAEGLQKTIDSLNEQDITDWEHIIQDGGSVDDSLRIMANDKCTKRHSRSSHDGGIYQGMNLALFQTTGNFVWFLNSGDVFAHSNVLRMVKESWEKFGWQWAFGGIIFESTSNNKATASLPIDISRKQVLRGNQFYPHPSCIYSKSLLSEIGHYRPEFGTGADQELCLRAESLDTPHIIPEFLAIFEPAGSAGGYTPLKYELMFRRIRKQSREQVGRNAILDSLWLIWRVCYRTVASLKASKLATKNIRV